MNSAHLRTATLLIPSVHTIPILEGVFTCIFAGNMARLNQGATLWSIGLIIACLTLLTSAPCAEKKPGFHLEYVCTEPYPVPNDEKGVPVIMLHGLSDVKETWNGIYENISTLTNRKVCIYDARNHGDSSWNDTFGISALVEDLENFMKLTKIERAVLVGHSMGGQTVMKFALSKPSKVAGIFLEDIGIDLPLGVETLVGYFVRRLQKSLFAIPDGADELEAKEAVQNYMIKATGRKILNEHYFKVLPLCPQDGVWKWKTNFVAIEKILDDIHLYKNAKIEGRYEGKAVFLYGKSSVFRVWEQEEDIRKLFPNAKTVGIEGADHFLHFNRPEFMEELLDFFN